MQGLFHYSVRSKLRNCRCDGVLDYEMLVGQEVNYQSVSTILQQLAISTCTFPFQWIKLCLDDMHRQRIYCVVSVTITSRDQWPLNLSSTYLIVSCPARAASAARPSGGCWLVTSRIAARGLTGQQWISRPSLATLFQLNGWLSYRRDCEPLPTYALYVCGLASDQCLESHQSVVGPEERAAR